ncbi:MAG: hypothetical protein HOV68_08940 [Streptomycetaceae bacterium]|nr:hypothetical protein [Streptomycetaceae bacterium]
MRDASAPVRLLLFALLVVGTMGMHTIGHPPEAHASMAASMEAPTGDAGRAAAADVRTSDHAPAAAPAAMPAEDCPDGHCAPAASTPDHGTTAPSGHGGVMGLGMASLCLAIVLAAFVLAVTLFALRRGGRRPRHLARGLWGRLASGLPPPRPPDLSRLAVLRI